MQDYLSHSILSSNRLLGLLDRNHTSKNYGSFHRSFWLQKTSDFSSSALQQGCLALALLFKIEDPQNIYFNSPKILDWALASLRYTFKLQKSDGSFDEWYVNERGWAGPTGYVLYAIFKAAEILNEHLTPIDQKNLELCAKKGIRHLKSFEEKDILANHQAMALLAVTQAAKFCKIALQDTPYDLIKRRLLNSFDQEGWSLEYDGADPGYQSATLSFLARVDRITQDPQIREKIEPQLKLVKLFFYPDGTFAGNIGSRGTSNLFFLGIEYWCNVFSGHEELRAAARHSLVTLGVPMPSDQEDHYLIYRLPEYLESFLEAKNSLTAPKPIFNSTKLYLKNSGFLIFGNSNYYFIANLNLGGAFKIFSHKKNKWLTRNSGWQLVYDNKIYSNCFNLNHQTSVNLSAGSSSTSGGVGQIRRPAFTPITGALFKIVCILFFWNSWLALQFKSWIRARIMTKPKKTSNITFSRTFSLSEDGITVSDKIMGLNKNADLYWGGEFLTRMVPQSQYFHLSELNLDSTIIKKISIPEYEIKMDFK